MNFKSFLGLSLVVGCTTALTPDGGQWFHPGSPFTVSHQTPTRHVGKGGTRLQSDPYGMPSYGRLEDDAFLPVRDDPYTAVVDFGRPSYQRHEQQQQQQRYHQQQQQQYQQQQQQKQQQQHQRHRAAAASTAAAAPPPPPPPEPKIREYERQQYFRSSHKDHGRPNSRGRPIEDEEFFFAGHPSYGGPGFEQGMPSFFQRPPSDSFSFAGRPSTSFHQRPLQPNTY